MTIRCRAPCWYRTYGKYRRTRRDNVILNKEMKKEGTCGLSVGGGIYLIDKTGKCISFDHWDNHKPKQQEIVEEITLVEK